MLLLLLLLLLVLQPILSSPLLLLLYHYHKRHPHHHYTHTQLYFHPTHDEGGHPHSPVLHLSRSRAFRAAILVPSPSNDLRRETRRSGRATGPGESPSFSVWSLLLLVLDLDRPAFTCPPVLAPGRPIQFISSRLLSGSGRACGSSEGSRICNRPLVRGG